jgi:diguanylate cyclase (GGDEF)-like protein
MTTSKRKYQRTSYRQVLIADDELINRELLRNMLEDEYDVITASDGSEALDIIRANSETISLVLLDLMMPKVNGFEVLEAIISDEKTKHIPVIVLTSEKSAEVDCLKLGASDFISKPFELPEVIKARVNRSIELSEDTHIIQLTERDPLTKLYNDQFFFEYAHEIDVHHPEWDMDSIVINVNHFRLVNELHGRDYGDEVLIAVADRIRDLLEQVEGIAARSDADNFYLYIRHQDNSEELLHRMGEGVRNQMDRTSIWLRMGLYDYTNEKIDVEKRFENATSACNTLRNNYNKYVAYYNRETHEAELLAEYLISNMEKSLQAGHFHVYYQGKYDIQADKPRLCSAEALVRWIHPERGFISPGSFISLFENNGLIQKLDRYIFREVASQIRKWKDDLGYSVPVSVNVSRLDMFENDLCQYFQDLLVEFDLSSDDILLEVTESAYAEDSEQLIRTVEELRSHGLRIEMDDFGSGYSSLNMLAVLPIDYLKLDMKFVQSIKDDDRRVVMLKLMLDIAEHLQVPVIAEGVETEKQYLLLKELGCNIIQGYYFAKPLQVNDFETLMKEEKDA